MCPWLAIIAGAEALALAVVIVLILRDRRENPYRDEGDAR